MLRAEDLVVEKKTVLTVRTVAKQVIREGLCHQQSWNEVR